MRRRPLLTADELAAYLRINRSTVYRIIKRQPIPSFKVGSEWRFDPDQIDKWTKARELTR